MHTHKHGLTPVNLPTRVSTLTRCTGCRGLMAVFDRVSVLVLEWATAGAAINNLFLSFLGLKTTSRSTGEHTKGGCRADLTKRPVDLRGFLLSTNRSLADALRGI